MWGGDENECWLVFIWFIIFEKWKSIYKDVKMILYLLRVLRFFLLSLLIFVFFI